MTCLIPFYLENEWNKEFHVESFCRFVPMEAHKESSDRQKVAQDETNLKYIQFN